VARATVRTHIKPPPSARRPAIPLKPRLTRWTFPCRSISDPRARFARHVGGGGLASRSGVSLHSLENQPPSPPSCHWPTRPGARAPARPNYSSKANILLNDSRTEAPSRLVWSVAGACPASSCCCFLSARPHDIRQHAALAVRIASPIPGPPATNNPERNHPPKIQENPDAAFHSGRPRRQRNEYCQLGSGKT